MEETSGTGQQLRLQDFAGSRFLIKNLRGAQLWETARLAVKDQRCQNLTIDIEMFTYEVISTLMTYDTNKKIMGEGVRVSG